MPLRILLILTAFLSLLSHAGENEYQSLLAIYQQLDATEQRLNAITLIAGPEGEQGPRGLVGPAGETGDAGRSLTPSEITRTLDQLNKIEASMDRALFDSHALAERVKEVYGVLMIMEDFTGWYEGSALTWPHDGHTWEPGQ